jgi:RNA polymerase sigma factor (sigma-70 family)
VNTLLRELAPQVLGALVRRYGGFDTCEDAVQEALLAAAQQWPVDGVPDNPKAWLITVASRRRIEMWRSDSARQRREENAAFLEAPADVSGVDDTLTLFLLCCHPSLTAASQIALTLRAVGGLTTAEIARAFLVPEATVAQRISRAKQKIKGAEFEPPTDIAPALHVLYLIFNEGYTASSGSELHRVELSSEAIRLTRRLPPSGEASGLLALMLLTDARRPARTKPDGSLVPLAEQDRSLWDSSSIDEGIALITATLQEEPLGPYQIQAAIAAVHAEAPTAKATDWEQILTLYGILQQLAPGPMVTLNRIVAVAEVHGPSAALDALSAAESDPALTGHHRVLAVRAHLLDMAGEKEAARAEYELAARRTLSLPEQQYLHARAARLDDQPAESDAGVTP